MKSYDQGLYIHYYSEAVYFGKLCQTVLNPYKIEKTLKVGSKTGREKNVDAFAWVYIYNLFLDSWFLLVSTKLDYPPTLSK